MYHVCEVLWPYVEAHYGLVGSLRFYRDGETHLIDSHAGVHQGDPLGSVLFALAIHDRLISVAEAYDIHIFAYTARILSTRNGIRVIY